MVTNESMMVNGLINIVGKRSYITTKVHGLLKPLTINASDLNLNVEDSVVARCNGYRIVLVDDNGYTKMPKAVLNGKMILSNSNKTSDKSDLNGTYIYGTGDPPSTGNEQDGQVYFKYKK